ncbi:hypothetical protein LR48_Vigan09g009200 [Vigna angularis]|uniref:Uncharacterized protein n=1 Tax=Phaseolus angularis TaxID=3914 RepID=A0A0L9V8U8_PHAAN|nr:hypothetical protein LR48_Vigan09g009200 [Vigna angularis]
MGVVCENEEGRGMAVKSQDENDDVDVYKSYRSSVGAVLEMIEMLLVECKMSSPLLPSRSPVTLQAVGPFAGPAGWC